MTGSKKAIAIDPDAWNILWLSPNLFCDYRPTRDLDAEILRMRVFKQKSKYGQNILLN